MAGVSWGSKTCPVEELETSELRDSIRAVGSAMGGGVEHMEGFAVERFANPVEGHTGHQRVIGCGVPEIIEPNAPETWEPVADTNGPRRGHR